jgi:hypothetical protein
MNRKFTLALLSSPALFASMVSMVVMTQPARANQVINQGNLVCMKSPHSAQHKFVCERRQAGNPGTVSAKQDTVIAQAQPNQITELNFSDEESDRAIALFGCDCPSCINALRQLDGIAKMAV